MNNTCTLYSAQSALANICHSEPKTKTVCHKKKVKWEEKSSEEQVSTHLNKRSSVLDVVKSFGSITAVHLD